MFVFSSLIDFFVFIGFFEKWADYAQFILEKNDLMNLII